MNVGLMVFALISIVAFVGVGIVVTAYYVLRQELRSSRRRQFKREKFTYQSQPYYLVSQEIQTQLLSMVGGNSATAYRLVDSVRANNPGRSDSWCWEKVIDDLVRDRR